MYYSFVLKLLILHCCDCILIIFGIHYFYLTYFCNCIYWKLYALGTRGNIYDWVKSYLTNRSQFVLYNNSKSEENFFSRVPHGSILGPLFFIVFMNIFSRASKTSIFFADDTTVLIEGQIYDKVIFALYELQKLDVLLQANKFKVIEK